MVYILIIPINTEYQPMNSTFTKTSKPEIFKAAWEMARHYAAEEGTGAKAQFARALREAHASAKSVDEMNRAAAERELAYQQDIYQEVQEARTALLNCGLRDSARKTGLRARLADLRARLAA